MAPGVQPASGTEVAPQPPDVYWFSALRSTIGGVMQNRSFRPAGGCLAAVVVAWNCLGGGYTLAAPAGRQSLQLKWCNGDDHATPDLMIDFGRTFRKVLADTTYEKLFTFFLLKSIYLRIELEESSKSSHDCYNVLVKRDMVQPNSLSCILHTLARNEGILCTLTESGMDLLTNVP